MPEQGWGGEKAQREGVQGQGSALKVRGMTCKVRDSRAHCRGNQEEVFSVASNRLSDNARKQILSQPRTDTRLPASDGI